MGFFENIAIKKIKTNSRKTLIDLCINNENELYNHFSKLNNTIIFQPNTIKINNEIVEYLMTETEKINQKRFIKNRNKSIGKTKY